MSSYYADDMDLEDTLVFADEDEDDVEQTEVKCPDHCRNGIVEVHGQETDCITCEGYGTILI